MSHPQDPQYPPPYPSQWEPPRPPKRSRAALWAALVAIDLLAVGLIYFVVVTRGEAGSTGSTGGGGVVAGEGWDGGDGGITEETPEPETSDPATPAPPTPTPEPAGIGDKVRDGDFSITITRMSRAETLGESEFTRIKAKGEYVVFHATVRNHREKTRFFLANSQDLYVGSKKYPTVLFLEFKGFLKKIKPGETMKGVFAFDVPEGAKPTRLVLHDDPSSEGAVVELTK